MILRKKHNLTYLTKLPVAAVKVKLISGVELLSLKEGKRVWKVGNISPREGLPLLIYSPSSELYWYRKLGEDHNMDEYRNYIRDGNLYIVFTEPWRVVISRERERLGMAYYDYNRIRELYLMDYLVDREERLAGWETKKRAIEIEVKRIKTKYL